MITSVKKFGSYVLCTNDSYRSEVNDLEDVKLHGCSIGNRWIELELQTITSYNHDTSILRFKLPGDARSLNLPVGGFLLVQVPCCEHDGFGPSLRPYTSVTCDSVKDGYFEILCKRYDQWGIKESIQTHFLFTRTNHSYRPAGIVSNYMHKLKVGDFLSFKHSAVCKGRIPYPFRKVRTLTMIAVGVGVAPMIQTLRAVFRDIACRNRTKKEGLCDDEARAGDAECSVEQVVLLYGVRTVKDILLREVLDEWQRQHGDVFKAVYCVGSRWANVHWGSKSKTEYKPPPPPAGFGELLHGELGWVNEEKIARHAFPPSDDTKVLVREAVRVSGQR